MDFNEEFSKNLKLHYSETLFRHDDSGKPRKVRFFFTFFGGEYVADVSSNSVENDFASIEAEGASELFDSFIDNLEDAHWEKLKDCFNKHLVDDLANA